jgi:hypothetical protein
MKLLDEMEKSMIIFKLKQGIMPILSWGVEDESLGDAVTIIATGFDIEQQNEIVNTEPKKSYTP